VKAPNHADAHIESTEHFFAVHIAPFFQKAEDGRDFITGNIQRKPDRWKVRGAVLVNTPAGDMSDGVKVKVSMMGIRSLT